MSAFRSLAGALLALWLILPLVPLAIWSVARGWRFPDILPQDWSLAAWRYALSDGAGVLDSLWTSTLVALAATVLALLAGVPAGRALGLHRFRGKALVELLILAPVIVPGLAVVFGAHTIFLTLGLANSFAGVVLVHLIPTLPYVTLVMAGVFANHDPAYEAQARTLGASAFATFRHVTLPAILPGLLVAALFAFLVSWSQYLLTLVIGGGRVATLPLTLYGFVSSGRNDLAGAIAVLYILPGVLVLILTARSLSGRSAAIAGMTRS